MTGQEIANRLISDNRYTLRACIEAKGKRYDYADTEQWAVHSVILDVVGMAYGFDDAESERFIKILVGEV